VNWVLRKPRAAKRILTSWFSSHLPTSWSSLGLDSRSTSTSSKSSSRRSNRQELVHQVAKACYKAMAAYVPKPYSGPITLFRAKSQPLFKPFERDLGWSKWARGPLEIIPVPGNHRSIFDEPYVPGVAQHLIRCLDKVEANRAMSQARSA
jgi:thioesterase domain-containing protein